MKRIVCEMCEGTEFVKSEGLFICQDCGCKYTVEEARKLMVEVGETAAPRQEPEQVSPEQEETVPEEEYPLHSPDSPNRISVSVVKVGHETYTMRSVASLAAFLGEPEPEFIAGPDVVGHIGAEIIIRHLAGKPIKYIVVYLTPYNAVGDEMFCSVEGHSTYGIEVTGPIPVGHTWQGYSDGIWYNGTIVTAKVAYATVEYLDGSKERFEADSLVAAEGGNSEMALVTVTYDGNGGAPGELWYTIDGGEKNTLYKLCQKEHYLQPGWHNISIKNPFMKQDYRIKAEGTKTVVIYGKSFGMDISEK